MNSKTKIIALISIFVISAFCPVFAFAADITLPSDAVKVGEKTSDFGPIKSLTGFYETSLNKDRLNSFYNRELVRAGWQKKGEGAFVKDKKIMVIICESSKNKAGKTEFLVTLSNIPPKEEFLAMYKESPESLPYMPIYPGSIQIYLLRLQGEVESAYETGSSIEDIAFFYKTGMLKYGWSLDYDFNIPDQLTDKEGIGLNFYKPSGETCSIKISGSEGFQRLEQDTENNQELAKNVIAVKYREY